MERLKKISSSSNSNPQNTSLFSPLQTPAFPKWLFVFISLLLTPVFAVSSQNRAPFFTFRAQQLKVRPLLFIFLAPAFKKVPSFSGKGTQILKN